MPPGPAGGGRADPMAFDLSSHLEPGGGGDRRRGPSVDGADDLAAIDALQVDGGDADVGMPKWPWDDYERDACVGHFDRVGVPELVGCEPPSHPRRAGGVVQLL